MNELLWLKIEPLSKDRKRVFLYVDVHGKSGIIRTEEAVIKIDFNLSEEESSSPIISTKGGFFILKDEKYERIRRRTIRSCLQKYRESIFKRGTWWWCDDPLVHEFCLKAEEEAKIKAETIRKFFDLIAEGKREEARALFIAISFLEEKMEEYIEVEEKKEGFKDISYSAVVQKNKVIVTIPEQKVEIKVPGTINDKNIWIPVNYTIKYTRMKNRKEWEMEKFNYLRWNENGEKIIRYLEENDEIRRFLVQNLLVEEDWLISVLANHAQEKSMELVKGTLWRFKDIILWSWARDRRSSVVLQLYVMEKLRPSTKTLWFSASSNYLKEKLWNFRTTQYFTYQKIGLVL